jgi:alkylhydroperoxidase/carboxymuconolactone decarboxylase family protein YurZ
MLRRISIGDVGLLAGAEPNGDTCPLDRKTQALVQLGALVAIDPAAPSYMRTIEEAHRCHATTEEIVGTLIAAMPVVGAARAISAAPKLGLALGYDVSDALERFDDRPPPAA